MQPAADDNDVWSVAAVQRPHRVTHGDEFFALMDAAFEDTHRAQWGPGYNRDSLVDAYRDGRFYTLAVPETDDLYRRCREFEVEECMRRGCARARRASGRVRFRCHRADLPVLPPFAYAHGATYLLPCLCVPTASGRLAEWIWVHPRARRRGLATRLLRDLGLHGGRWTTEPSRPFWRAVAERLPPPAVPDVPQDAGGQLEPWLQVRLLSSGLDTRLVAAVTTAVAARFGAGYAFDLLPRCEGGIEMTDWPGAAAAATAGHKSLRLPGCRNWPHVEGAGQSLAHWMAEGQQPPTVLRFQQGAAAEGVVHLTFVAYGDAPGWTAGEIAHFAHALCAQPGVVFHDWGCSAREVRV